MQERTKQNIRGLVLIIPLIILIILLDGGASQRPLHYNAP